MIAMSRFAIFFLAGFVFLLALLLSAPASLLNPMLASTSIVSHTHIRGSVWSGVIENLSAEGVFLGRARYKLRPLSLLLAKPSFALTLSGGAVSGHGNFTVSRESIAIKNGAFRVSLGDITTSQALGMPVRGRADIDVASLHFNKNGCQRASGTISTDFLNGTAEEFGASGFVLAGPADCDGDDLRIKLAGEGDEGSANVVLLVKPNLTYSMEAMASPTRSEVATALSFLGFEATGTGLNYQVVGRLSQIGS